MNSLAQSLVDLMVKQGKSVTTAESCTGGLVAAAITSISGSSNVFEQGFVTYANRAKQETLDVLPQTLAQYGAVSEQTAKEMAEGALKKAKADISISTTGIAGPTGGTPEKPVGTVCFGLAFKERKTITQTYHFQGDRDAVRQQTVDQALTLLINHSAL